MFDKHSHSGTHRHNHQDVLEENVEFKSSSTLNHLLEKEDHFVLPGPTLKPRLNIQPIHPKTDLFLDEAKKQKKSSLWFKISLFGLALATIFVVFAGLNLYAQTKSVDQNKNIENCTNAASVAKNKGIQIDVSQCKTATGWNNLFGQDLSSAAYFKTKDEIAVQQNKLEDSISSVNNRIAVLKVQLTSLKVSFDEIPAAVKDDNLVVYSTSLQSQETGLQNLLDKNLPKIQSSLEEAKGYLTKLPSVSTEDKNFINTFSTLNADKQVENYIKLEELTAKLKLALESMSAKSTYPIVGSITDYKFFTPKNFQDLYESVVYTNVQEAQPIVNITGNETADNYIRGIAERRGYKKRVQAITANLVNVDGYKLQSKAATDWKAMKAAALKDKVYLGLVSGFRGYDDQRSIFIPSLRDEANKQLSRDFTSSDITSGSLDGAINAVLNTSSIPGYSKHHTGYTVDFTDTASGKFFTKFEETAGHVWLSENNFYNAKRFGFIPSYPKGGTNFGPNYESWEYVWVGSEVLK